MITYCKKAEGIKRGIYRDIRDIFEILYFPVFNSSACFGFRCYSIDGCFFTAVSDCPFVSLDGLVMCRI